MLKELGYNIESLLNEFDFIDWEDIPGFPVRVKYCLKMKIHGNDELRATDASYLSRRKATEKNNYVMIDEAITEDNANDALVLGVK